MKEFFDLQVKGLLRLQAREQDFGAAFVALAVAHGTDVLRAVEPMLRLEGKAARHFIAAGRASGDAR